jgi:hypothetical protein
MSILSRQRILRIKRFAVCIAASLSASLAAQSTGPGSDALPARPWRASIQPPRTLDRQVADSTLLLVAVTLDVRNAPLNNALRELSRQVAGRILYDNSVTANAKPVTYRAKDVSLLEALTAVLDGTETDVVLSENGRLVVLKKRQSAEQPLSASGQDTVDIVKGKVLGPDSAAVKNALVTLTDAKTGVRIQGRTNERGEFRMLIKERSGDYELVILVIGLKRYQKRVTRTGPGEIDAGVAYLERPAAKLGQVNTVANRRAAPNVGAEFFNPPPGEKSEWVQPPGGLTGDIGAIVARIAAVQATGDNTFSVLGMGATANTITINGAPIAGDLVPRDALFAARLVVNTYDVSRGGFSGGQIAFTPMSSLPALNYTFRIGLDHPQLQWTNPTGDNFGQRFRNLQFSGALNGPVGAEKNKLSVSLSYEVGRRSSDIQSLLNADAEALHTLGVAPDSLQHFLDLIGSTSIPLTVASVPTNNALDRRTVALRLDHGLPWAGDRHGQYIQASVGQNVQGPWSLDTRALPTTAGEITNRNLLLQIGLSDKIGEIFLNQFVASYSTLRTRSTRYLDLPDGRVIVNSDLGEGTGGISTLSFGGSAAAGDANDLVVSEFRNETSWQSLDKSHVFKASLSATYNGTTQTRGSNSLGTYFYNSLADLAAERPSAFTRTLFAPERNGASVTGAVSLGDTWRKSDRLQVLFGARLENSRFVNAPAYNPAIDTIFGRRTDALPTETRVSPALGFNWNYGLGVAGSRKGTLKGGIREFRGSMGTPSRDATGLPTDIRQITCLGAAVPLPDWDLFAEDPSAIPNACADGGTGTVFSNTVPNVIMMNPNYNAARRVGASIGWTTVFKRIPFSLDVDYSRGNSLESSVDLNFINSPKFALASEGGRPVFVTPASIVPATGAVSTREARISDRFNQVLDRRSDLHTIGRQVSLTLNRGGFNSAPLRLFGIPVSGWLTYVHSSSITESRGFTSTTGGDPLLTEWGPSGQPKHSITFNGNLGNPFAGVWGHFRGFGWGSLGISLRFTSGFYYTPAVLGDINGDGISNDRAFIFDPSVTGDAALAEAMGKLLEGASSGAKKCLQKQLGRVAGRNSCQGPWSAALDLVYRPSAFGLARNPNVLITIGNPLGGLDQLLHGWNHMRGWGQPAIPEATLLSVKGFDPTSQRFIYDVNPRFGEALRNAFAQPFTIKVEASLRKIQFSDSRTIKAVFGWDPAGKEPFPTVEQVLANLRKPRFGAPVNLFALALAQKDTILLVDAQMTRLTALARQWQQEQDSIYRVAAERFVATKGKLSSEEVREWSGFSPQGPPDTEVLRIAKWGKLAKEILSPEQWALLPAFTTGWIDMAIAREEEIRGN